jgi:hypothetical protein
MVCLRSRMYFMHKRCSMYSFQYKTGLNATVSDLKIKAGVLHGEVLLLVLLGNVVVVVLLRHVHLEIITLS